MGEQNLSEKHFEKLLGYEFQSILSYYVSSHVIA